MVRRWSLCLLATVAFSVSFVPAVAVAQKADREPIAIIELGVAASRSLNNGSAGATVAFEVTPIENWLELEAGVTSLFNRSATEWDTDLLFKKPWTLSKKVEFMAGIGPEWVHTNQPGAAANSISAEAALDFMYWPAVRHRFGWYVEPGFEHNFGRQQEQAFAISGGLLIAIP